MPKPGNDTLARLKETCAFISGPDGTGTGYLVAPRRIATALHVVRSWQTGQKFPVIVGVGGPSCQASLLKSDPSADAAVLGFDEDIGAAPLPIADSLERNVAWEAYGFPALATKIDRPPGLPIEGQVKDPATQDDVGQAAVLLYSDAVAAGDASPLHGFSGSPVLVDGALVGHLTKHLGDPDDKRRAAFGYVYACPIRAVVGLLDVAPQKVAIAPSQLETLADSVPPIEADGYHVFVSYRSTDRDWAMSLVARLEGAGLRVFIDHNELVAGEYLAKQLESGLERSRAAVVLVSKGWLESPWCQEEANALVKRAVEDKTFKLVPLRLDDSSMPALLDARYWLDFNGTTQAEGENLTRLLSALTGRAPPPAESPTARANAAEVRVTDKFVDEIRSAARLDGRRIVEIVGEWRKTSSTDVAPLIAAAEALNGKARFEATLQVLDGARETLRVRQLRALALRKMDRVDEAIAMLEPLQREGQLDPETGGILAGSYRIRWLKTRDQAFRQLAYQMYSQTYERTGDPYNGINTAAMALHCGDPARMYQVAGEVRDSLLKKRADELKAWDLATLGEACLLLKRLDDAREWYAKAAGKAAGLHQDIAVMRRFARLDLEALGEPRNRLDDVLPVPRVLAYFGHMVDVDRPTPRFPAGKVGALRKVVRARLEKYGHVHGFGQAARGTDLIVLEELAKRGLTATVVLPFPEADFLATSVGGTWNDRFAELRDDQRIEFVPPLRSSPPAKEDLPRAFAEGNREVFRLAIEYARRLDEDKPIVLAVWDGKPGDGPGGTADAVALWRDEAYEVDVIDITKEV